MTTNQRAWAATAIGRIEAEFRRSADTHLIPLDLPGHPHVDLYFKDESSHPTGSLKHRLARSLFLHALANGWLREGTRVIEASSGSTAVSEAYFARLLALPFTAVMPKHTSPEKIAAIEFQGGACLLVDDAAECHRVAVELARTTGGHFMDQFTYAEQATDWRANNNIAESIFQQLASEPAPMPAWIVCGAGTGGTSATLGRYVRYRRYPTRILCADPERSAFFDYYRAHRAGEPFGNEIRTASRIEGVGRPRPESSFIPGCIDEMVRVPDALSLAGTRYLSARLGRTVGGSTGMNLIGVLAAASLMRRDGQRGSIVTLICDGGERYRQSYFDPAWYARQGLPIDTADRELAAVLDGTSPPRVEFAAG
ncbi:MAG: PLP-dependent cysteine synthase family protein [Steroidobacteraceae bacterium]